MVGRKTASEGPSQRQLRVGEEIRRVLARAFERGGFRDPDLYDVSVTVSEVSVSPDLRQATVYILPLGGGDDGRILAALKRASGYLSGMAARELSMKYAPSLNFRRDEAFDASARIDALMQDPVIRADVEKAAQDRDGDVRDGQDRDGEDRDGEDDGTA